MADDTLWIWHDVLEGLRQIRPRTEDVERLQAAVERVRGMTTRERLDLATRLYVHETGSPDVHEGTVDLVDRLMRLEAANLIAEIRPGPNQVTLPAYHDRRLTFRTSLPRLDFLADIDHLVAERKSSPPPLVNPHKRAAERDAVNPNAPKRFRTHEPEESETAAVAPVAPEESEETRSVAVRAPKWKRDQLQARGGPSKSKATSNHSALRLADLEGYERSGGLSRVTEEPAVSESVSESPSTTSKAAGPSEAGPSETVRVSEATNAYAPEPASPASRLPAITEESSRSTGIGGAARTTTVWDTINSLRKRVGLPRMRFDAEIQTEPPEEPMPERPPSPHEETAMAEAPPSPRFERVDNPEIAMYEPPDIVPKGTKTGRGVRKGKSKPTKVVVFRDGPGGPPGPPGAGPGTAIMEPEEPEEPSGAGPSTAGAGGGAPPPGPPPGAVEDDNGVPDHAVIRLAELTQGPGYSVAAGGGGEPPGGPGPDGGDVYEDEPMGPPMPTGTHDAVVADPPTASQPAAEPEPDVPMDPELGQEPAAGPVPKEEPDDYGPMPVDHGYLEEHETKWPPFDGGSPEDDAGVDPVSASDADPEWPRLRPPMHRMLGIWSRFTI